MVEPFFGPPTKTTDQSHLDVFMLMPFSSDLHPVYDNHIKKVVATLGLSIRRADDFFTVEAIMGDIWLSIRKARAIIADCTTRNPNVFYEIGIAHTIGKPVVLITQESDDIPFDLRHVRYIKYSYTPPGMMEFEATLRSTLKEVLADNGVQPTAASGRG